MKKQPSRFLTGVSQWFIFLLKSLYTALQTKPSILSYHVINSSKNHNTSLHWRGDREIYISNPLGIILLCTAPSMSEIMHISAHFHDAFMVKALCEQSCKWKDMSWKRTVYKFNLKFLESFWINCKMWVLTSYERCNEQISISIYVYWYVLI